MCNFFQKSESSRYP